MYTPSTVIALLAHSVAWIFSTVFMFEGPVQFLTTKVVERSPLSIAETIVQDIVCCSLIPLCNLPKFDNVEGAKAM